MRWLGILALVLVVIVLLLGLAEVGTRFVMEPKDVLKSKLLPSERYGVTLAPGVGGADDLGFRNLEVPGQADTLVLGDGLTYGPSAQTANTWPAWLQNLSGQRTVNMGIKGYGPVQYLRLIQDYELRFRPKTVVIGLSLGDDIWDAWDICRAFDASAPDLSACKATDWDLSGEPQGWKAWAGSHSMLYNLAEHAFKSAKRKAGKAEEDLDPDALFVEKGAVRTGFKPGDKAGKMDLTQPETALGFSVTQEAFQAIKSLCAEKEMRCVVVLLPSKETVLSPMVRDALPPGQSETWAEILQSEEQLRTILGSLLSIMGFEVVDPLAPLQAQAERLAIYPESVAEDLLSVGNQTVARVVRDAMDAGGE